MRMMLTMGRNLNRIRRLYAVLLPFVLLISACSSKKTMQAGQWNALGTVCSVNAFEDGGDDLYTAIAIRLDEIDSQFSVNRKTSDISRVNAAAGRERVTVSKEVFTVLQTALDFAQKSGGAFDPSIGPVVTLWGICTDHPRVPSQHEIDAALSL
ncbi:MAG: FAD:protein FMN transferase, partial [Treponema sp.]|nr:FAD:protein FMN transferase [Treponema sp.]